MDEIKFAPFLLVGSCLNLDRPVVRGVLNERRGIVRVRCCCGVMMNLVGCLRDVNGGGSFRWQGVEMEDSS